MANAQTGMLVFKSGAGDFFLVPQATLEQCRVPAEHTGELEQYMMAATAQGGAHGDDVRGHSPVAIGIAAACIIYTALDLSFDGTNAILGEKVKLGPGLHQPYKP